jgi:hypothetical protein
MAMPAKTAADAVAADVISKAECARRLGLTRGQISQLTAPGQSLAEAMTAEGRIRWRLASALLRARADGAKTRLPRRRRTSPSPSRRRSIR